MCFEVKAVLPRPQRAAAHPWGWTEPVPQDPRPSGSVAPTRVGMETRAGPVVADPVGCPDGWLRDRMLRCAWDRTHCLDQRGEPGRSCGDASRVGRPRWDGGRCQREIEGQGGRTPIGLPEEALHAMHPLPWMARDTLTEGYGLAAFIDVETTGLHPGRDEILELAIVLFAFDRATGVVVGIVDEYVGLREPSRSIPRQATAVHGITRRMVRGRRLDDDRVRTLLAQAEFVVAHNARFDYGFVCRLYPEAANKPWLCSMEGVDWRRHGYPSRGLQRLLAAHGIPVRRAHRAGADCKAALVLLSHQRNGQTYLQELLAHAPWRETEGARRIGVAAVDPARPC